MYLEIIKSAILGVVEGVTEFLPISSTGHLILVNEWVKFSEPFTTMFDIVIQLGAILAVVVYFWKKLWPFGKKTEERKKTFQIWSRSLVGVLPAIILGALLGKIVEEKLFNPLTVALTLIIGGLILIYIEKRSKKNTFESVASLPYKIPFFIGLIQCFSMIPGTSRAGATIVGGMLLGLSRVVAVEFSFFLAIPTMVAASAYSLLKHGLTMSLNEMIVLGVGFIVAFFTALGVIKFFIGYVQKNDFKLFGYYRIVLGALILFFFLFM